MTTTSNPRTARTASTVQTVQTVQTADAVPTAPDSLSTVSAPRPPRPRVASRRGRPAQGLNGVRAFSWALAVGSGLALFFVVFLLVLSPLQQSRAQSVLYTKFRSELAAATAPFGVDPIAPGAPVALIELPALGMRQVIVEGTSGGDLRNGPGHLRVTPLPGQVGTSVIFGRSTTYGGPFRDMPSLKRGTPIRVTTGQGVFTYRVEDVRRDGDRQPPVLEADQSRLLFVTTDSATLGAFKTVYIDALLVSDPAVTPPRGALPVSDFENEMGSDPNALLPLALWLLALVGAGAFAAWGLARWGRGQTWLIALPLLLVSLWGASDSAAMLLPNLM